MQCPLRRKADCLCGVGGGEELGGTANRPGVSVGCDGNVLELVVTVIQHGRLLKTTELYFKTVQEFYLNF